MVVLTDRRDQVVRALTKHCGDGRLTLDELESRIEEAYAAESVDELEVVLRDLPTVLGATAPPVAAPVHQERGLPPLPALPSLEEIDPHWKRTIGTLCTVGGFVLLFNGMFWLAILVWFILPGLIAKKRLCR